MQQVACLRCRKQKLRCSRDAPSCRRCETSDNDCIYPSPPDRKLLAANRRRPKEAPKSHSKSHSPEGSGTSSGSARSTSDSPSLACAEDYSPCLFVSTGHDEQSNCSPFSSKERIFLPEISSMPIARTAPTPPTTVAMMLMETYSTHLHYHVTLIDNMETVISSYLAGTIDPALSFSIFAVASTFLRSSLNERFLEDRNFDPSISRLSLQGWSKHGLIWATFASEDVLKHSDIPSMSTIKVCQNLAIYWFSVGQIERANFHEDLAYRSCRRLKLHRALTTNDDLDLLFAEANRRSFWSCWASLCFNQPNSSFRAECWKEVEGLPLPSSKVSYNNRLPIAIEAFDINGNILKQSNIQESPQPSMIGELMKFYGLWWEVQRLVRQKRQKSWDTAVSLLSDYLRVDKRLKAAYEVLPFSFRYEWDTQFKNPTVDPYGLFLLNSLYCLCACVLYSSIEPLISICSADTRITSQMLCTSGPEALRHSLLMTKMSAAFLAAGLDFSRLPPAVGYSAFMSCFLRIGPRCSRGNSPDHDFHDHTGAMDILMGLKEYWHPLQRLWLLLGEFSIECDYGQKYATTSTLDFDVLEAPLGDIVDIIGRPVHLSSLKAEPQPSPFIGVATYSSTADFGVTGMSWDGEDISDMGIPIFSQTELST